MTDIRIGSIRLRAENLTPAQGQQLGERVAALLTEQLVGGGQPRRQVAYLQARLVVQGDESVEQLAARVVSAIIERM